MINSNSIRELEVKRQKRTPLYEQVHQQLKNTIEAESLQPGDRLPAIYSLAKKWDINYRTVRSAFELLEKDGVIVYEANKGAVVAENHKIKTRLVFSYVRWIRDAFCVSISNGIRDYCADRNISFRMLDAQRSDEIFLDAILHPAKGVDGILVVPEHTEKHKRAVKESLALGHKVVLLDRHIPGVNTSSVCPDHFSGAYQAVNHLIEQHGLPVYYLGRFGGPTSCQLWYDGWREAMQNANIFDFEKYSLDTNPYEEDCPKRYKTSQQANNQAAENLLQTIKQDKFCIFTGNNYVARSVYLAANKRGLKIGKDVFVVGAGDAPTPESFVPPLSCISQHSQEVGYEGARVLDELIKGVQKTDVNVLLPTNVEVRKSSMKN